MNSSVYLFGEFNCGYAQYPDDYTSEIFRIFHENAKPTTQLVIHRNGQLMYYGYIRKLESNHYIGLCVVLNGLLVSRIDDLFRVFEETISELVIRGLLIQFNEQGSLVTKEKKLYINKEEFDFINEFLRNKFNRLESCIKALPAVCFGVSKDSIKIFAEDNDVNEIVNSTHTNGFTIVNKSQGYNTPLMSSYMGVLAKVNKEKNKLLKELKTLKVKHAKTLKQKKQMKKVNILFFIVFLCIGGLYYLSNDLNTTRNALLNANDTINVQNKYLNTARKALSNANDSINNMNVQIINLNNANSELEKSRQAEEIRRVQAEKNFDDLKSDLANKQSFIVKRSSFNFSTGYLKFDYYGLKEEITTLTVRVYSDNGYAFSANSRVHIKEGNYSTSIYVSRSIDNRKWYSFEILKGSVILGGGRH